LRSTIGGSVRAAARLSRRSRIAPSAARAGTPGTPIRFRQPKRCASTGAAACCWDAGLSIPGAGLWDLPGGFLHENEHPLDALRREIREETSLELEDVDFLGFWLEPYDGRIVLSLVWTASALGHGHADDDLVELQWFDSAELPDAGDFAFSHQPAVVSAALARRHENP
jgi:8-oxo-dGTP diphosphatase